MQGTPIFEMYVFDVGLGQSIFFRPVGNEYYNIMIDVGHDSENEKHPIDYIINSQILPIDTDGYYYIGDLTITNYDHDHYSGLPYLMSRAKVSSASLIKSIPHELLNQHKPEKTDALNHLIHIKQTYTTYAENRNPPYAKWNKFLYPSEERDGDFNNLSQIVFIEYGGFNICIPGDLEKEGRSHMLQDSEVAERLKRTHIFFASHHGRENGYMKEIFDHCNPNVVIISDKEITHATQEKCADIYGKHVVGDGLNFGGQLNRKVISTRNDGSFCFYGYDGLNYKIEKISF